MNCILFADVGPDEHRRHRGTDNMYVMQAEVQSSGFHTQAADMQASLLFVVYQVHHDEGYGSVLRQLLETD